LVLRFIRVVHFNGNQAKLITTYWVPPRLPATTHGVDVERRPLGPTPRTQEVPWLDFELEIDAVQPGVGDDRLPSESHGLWSDCPQRSRRHVHGA
jgi:hypothetical protein